MQISVNPSQSTSVSSTDVQNAIANMYRVSPAFANIIDFLRDHNHVTSIDILVTDATPPDEIAHFTIPDHGRDFLALLDRHMPGWRTVRDRLNEGPLPPIL